MRSLGDEHDVTVGTDGAISAVSVCYSKTQFAYFGFNLVGQSIMRIDFKNVNWVKLRGIDITNKTLDLYTATVLGKAAAINYR